MKKLYKFHWEVRRMGYVEGMFVATEKEIEDAMGKNIYFGDILGKHSEIYGVLEKNDLMVLSEDQEFIKKLLEIFNNKFTISGYNPLAYIQEDDE